MNLIMFSSVLPSFDDVDKEYGNNDGAIDKKNQKTQGLGFGEFMGLMKGLQ